MSEFDDDLAQSLTNVEAARKDLLELLATLPDETFDVGRRGGWTVGQVLAHVIDSENHYAAGIRHLRGDDPATPRAPFEGSSIEDAKAAMETARGDLLRALDGVDEETFYRLGRILHQDYSVMSILENVEFHDREHEGQIRALTARS